MGSNPSVKKVEYLFYRPFTITKDTLWGVFCDSHILYYEEPLNFAEIDMPCTDALNLTISPTQGEVLRILSSRQNIKGLSY